VCYRHPARGTDDLVLGSCYTPASSPGVLTPKELGWSGAIAVVNRGWCKDNPMGKKRIFISFRAEDKNKVNGLRLLAVNEKFDIEFYDESVKIPINSENAAYLKTRLAEKLSRTSVTICMVSELTHTSEWVDWELEKSYAKGNNVIYMGFKDGPNRLTLPKAGRDRQAIWYLWDHEGLYWLIGDV
jgi:MTH538 TIR-like domain (DUF1863)